MDITLLYFDGCPNWQTTDRLLAELAEEFRFEVNRRQVSTLEEADELDFRGSPTVLVDGLDPFADPDSPTGLSCRVYPTEEGLRGTPTLDMLRAAVTR